MTVQPVLALAWNASVGIPLLIVVVAADLGPWEAIKLAATKPDDYARIIGEAHLSIAAFGGAFLMTARTCIGLPFWNVRWRGLPPCGGWKWRWCWRFC